MRVIFPHKLSNKFNKNKSNKNLENICINKNALYEILKYKNLSDGDRNQINRYL